MSDYQVPNLKTVIIQATNLFKEHFNADSDFCSCAPGRVNLIGEHIDYNEGFVLPMVSIIK